VIINPNPSSPNQSNDPQGPTRWERICEKVVHYRVATKEIVGSAWRHRAKARWPMRLGTATLLGWWIFVRILLPMKASIKTSAEVNPTAAVVVMIGLLILLVLVLWCAWRFAKYIFSSVLKQNKGYENGKADKAEPDRGRAGTAGAVWIVLFSLLLAALIAYVSMNAYHGRMSHDGLILWGFLINFVCALLASAVAKRNGNSPTAGFFIGLLLGPIGLLVVVLSQSSTELKERGADAGSGFFGTFLKYVFYVAVLVTVVVVAINVAADHLPKDALLGKYAEEANQQVRRVLLGAPPVSQDLCPTEEPQDFTEDSRKVLHVAMQSAGDCHRGPIMPPWIWNEYDIVPEGGDALIWCADSSEPTRVHHAGEAFSEVNFCGSSPVRGKPGQFTSKFFVKGSGFLALKARPPFKR
jgi:hypothetical protein